MLLFLLMFLLRDFVGELKLRKESAHFTFDVIILLCILYLYTLLFYYLLTTYTITCGDLAPAAN